MKAWGIKGPHGLIEVHGDLGRAMRSAVKHRIENGMDVKVIEVKVEEVETDKKPEESSSSPLTERAETNRGEVNSVIDGVNSMITHLEDLTRTLVNKLNSMKGRLKAVEELAWEEDETIEHLKDENRRLDQKIQNEGWMRNEIATKVMERLDVVERDITDIRGEIGNIYQRLEVIEQQKLEELHNRLIVVEEGIESMKDRRERLEEVEGE